MHQKWAPIGNVIAANGEIGHCELTFFFFLDFDMAAREEMPPV